MIVTHEEGKKEKNKKENWHGLESPVYLKKEKKKKKEQIQRSLVMFSGYFVDFVPILFTSDEL